MPFSVEELKERAAMGDVEAIGILGEIYLHGNEEIKQNYERAYQFLRQSAEGGNIRAWTSLGILYMEGWHVAQDIKKALSCFERANDAGDMKAPRYIGLLYRNHKIPAAVPEKVALDYFHIGADRGDITSQYYLGEMYELGMGSDKDMDKALQWYRKSAERGDKIAQPAIDALKRLSKEKCYSECRSAGDGKEI